MKVAVEELESCKRRLAVEAPLDIVQKEWEKAYGRVQKRARLPGFRRGHVPRSLVKLHFADDVRREVAEHLIPDVYRQALSEAQIAPVNEPDLQDLKLEEDAPLSVHRGGGGQAGDHPRRVSRRRGAARPSPVTDAEVDETLERMREQHAEFRSVERAAATGDMVIVDYTLAPQDHEPSTATGYHFLVGSGTVLPEIDAAAVGLTAGQERDVPVSFADDHRMESLRGKGGNAHLKLTEVKEKILPALDDDFAKVLGQFETLDAVRTEVRNQLASAKEADSRRALEDKIIEALLARHEFGIPDAMVMRQVGHHIEHTRDRLRRQGVDPDRVQLDYSKLLTELRPAAEASVRRSLLLEAIGEKEEIAVGDAEIEAEIERYARASQRPAPAVRRMMEKSGDLDALRHGLRERKTLDMLIEHARVSA